MLLSPLFFLLLLLRSNWWTGRVINPTLFLLNRSHSYCNSPSGEFKAEAPTLRIMWAMITQHRHTCHQTSKWGLQTSSYVADWGREQKERLYSSSSTHLCQILHHHFLDTSSYGVTLIPREGYLPRQILFTSSVNRCLSAQTDTSGQNKQFQVMKFN